MNNYALQTISWKLAKIFLISFLLSLKRLPSELIKRLPLSLHVPPEGFEIKIYVQDGLFYWIMQLFAHSLSFI